MSNQSNIHQARIAACFIFLVSGIAVACWAPMVPIIKARFALNEAELGLLLFTFGVGAFASMPFTGWLVRCFGSKNVTIVGAPLLACMIPFLTIAPNVFWLSITLLFFGILSGSLNISMNSQAVAIETKYSKPIMSRFHCFFSLGGLVGAGCVSLLLEWGCSLLTCGLVLGVVLLLIAFSQSRYLLPASDDVKADSEEKGVVGGFRFPSRKMLVFGLFCFIFFLAEGAMLDWSAVLLRSTYGYEVEMAGIGYVCFSIAMTIGRMWGDRFIARFGAVNAVRVGSLLCAMGLLCIVGGFLSYLELVGFLLIGFGASNVVPTVFSATGRVSETSAAAGLTVVVTMGYVGLLMGPAMIGWVAQLTTLPFALGCVALLVGIVGWNARLVERDVVVATR